MDMRDYRTSIPGVLIIEPNAFDDSRGILFENWERDRYAALGLPSEWRQDNIVHSRRGVLRGMHFQHPQGQHKLISVVFGEIFDVAVDVRRGSPTFGRWVGSCLSASDRKQLSIPVGFAHGYLSLSEVSVVSYKCSDRYEPKAEHVLRWDDPRVGIAWPSMPLLVSPRDEAGVLLDAFRPEELPEF